LKGPIDTAKRWNPLAQKRLASGASATQRHLGSTGKRLKMPFAGRSSRFSWQKGTFSAIARQIAVNVADALFVYICKNDFSHQTKCSVHAMTA